VTIDSLRDEPGDLRWLVTGCAGFIGANLVEFLLSRDQSVSGIDNLTSGSRRNLEAVRKSVSDVQWSRFEFHQGDIRSVEDCEKACQGADYVLHQAAISSPVEAEASPTKAIDTNVRGFANVIETAAAAGARRIVYASSCAVYGLAESDVQAESDVADPNTVYAITKHADELLAKRYAERFGIAIAGLRYFNCYGKWQAAQSGYSAFIPKCISAILNDEPLVINGDGETTRDFVHVDDVVRANVLAALAPGISEAPVYNVGTGRKTTLNELFDQVRMSCYPIDPKVGRRPDYGPFRDSDIRHSRAETMKARAQLGFEAQVALSEGLRRAAEEKAGERHGDRKPADDRTREIRT